MWSRGRGMHRAQSRAPGGGGHGTSARTVQVYKQWYETSQRGVGCVCVCVRQLGIRSGNSDEVGRKKLKTMGRQKSRLLKWLGGQLYLPNSLGTAPHHKKKKQPNTFPEVDLTCLCGFGFGAVMRALNTELELQGLAQVLLLSDKKSICNTWYLFLDQH